MHCYHKRNTRRQPGLPPAKRNGAATWLATPILPSKHLAPSIGRPQRLYPDTVQKGNLLVGIAGACRYVWNQVLADCEFRYARGLECRVGAKPSVSFFLLGKRFTALRNDPDHAWLKDYAHVSVKYILKYMADAYTRFFKDTAEAVPSTKPSNSPRRVSPSRPMSKFGMDACGYRRSAGSGLRSRTCTPDAIR